MAAMSTPNESRGRVIGIGGVFFKSADHAALRAWYGENLGIHHGADGMMFPWRAADQPDVERFTIWSVFPDASTYFDPSQSRFLINYIVDDLDALLAKLAATGVRIDPKREDFDYGRFAWIYDPDGNKIELWQPMG
jgi:predicted enzyme related to lactoylglutathione lyase